MINVRNFVQLVDHFITGLDNFLLILSVFLVPFSLLAYGLVVQPRIPPWYSLIPLCIGIMTILCRFVFLAFKGREQLLNLWLEISFVLQARSAWSIGSGLACCVLGLYFLFPSDSNLSSRYEASLGLYTGIIGATLAINAFYRRTAPITNIEALLGQLVQDMKASCPDGSRLWIVFPALNIGYYRTLRELGMTSEEGERRIPETHIYDEFRKELLNRAYRLGSKAFAVTYPRSLYEKMYNRYEQIQTRQGNLNQRLSDQSTQARVAACVAEAERLLTNFTLLEIPPDAFPQHIILVGNIVYTIMSYGLPMYEPSSDEPDHPQQNQWFGSFVGGEDRPVTLLVYRREDPSLSRLISEHLTVL